jgi:hypothetical protein
MLPAKKTMPDLVKTKLITNEWVGDVETQQFI